MNPPLPASAEWQNGGFDMVIQPTAPQIPVPRAPAPPPKLNVVLPFNERDLPAAIRLLKWCFMLSGTLQTRLFLLPFKGLDYTGDLPTAADFAFSEVKVIRDGEGIESDWQDDGEIRDAAGPNSMFRQAAWFFYLNQALGPWLYLEPDCVPLTPDWHPQLESEWRNCGKDFVGATMRHKNASPNDEYMNGVAIYPANAVQLAPSLVNRTHWEQHPEKEVAFDIAGATEVLRRGHITKKIQILYRAKFKSKKDYLSKVTREAVLFHGDREGSIIKILGGATEKTPAPTESRSQPEKKAGRASQKPKRRVEQLVARPTHNRKVAGSSPAPATNGSATIGDQIQIHVDALERIINGQTSRKQRMLAQMRRKRLIPQALRR